MAASADFAEGVAGLPGEARARGSRATERSRPDSQYTALPRWTRPASRSCSGARSRPPCWRSWRPRSPAFAGLILPEAGGGSKQAEDIQTLYVIIFVLGLIVFLGVEGVLIWCLFKYRARKGRVAAQIHGNTRLEIGWTVGAAVILVFLTIATFVMLPGIKNPAASDIDLNGNPVASNAAFASTDQEAPPERRRDEHRGRRHAVRLAVHVPVDRRQEGLLVHGHVRARGDDGHARHPLQRRAALVVDPGARRQDGRAAGLHEQDLVQGHRAGDVAGPVRRAVRAQPREHVRARDRAAVRRVEGLVRQAGQPTSRPPRRTPPRAAAEQEQGSSGWLAIRAGMPRPRARRARRSSRRRSGPSRRAGRRGSRRPTTSGSGSSTSGRSPSSSSSAASRRC